MKSRLTTILGVGLLAMGLAGAQTTQPTTPGPQQPGQHRMARHAMRGSGMMMGHIARNLNLTDAQKAQAKEIFQAARDASKPVATQLGDARKALRDAVKSNAADVQIDQLSTNVGTLEGQLTAIRTKAFSKFYNTVLTPEQRDQAAASMQNMRQRMGQRFGRGAGAPNAQPQQ